MHKEIEIKARLTNIEALTLIEQFNEMFGDGMDEHKKDTYYHHPDGYDVRLRRQAGMIIYTRKDQTMRGGVEVNDEEELMFTETMALALEKTVEEFLTKEKLGYLWQVEVDGFRLNVEVVQVKGSYEKAPEKDLGSFIEMEILLEDPTDEEIQKAKDTLVELCSSLDLYEKIEKKKYAALLQG